jgi:hypothetical protein
VTVAVSIIVGIDLGTTNSAVAYMAENGPRLIPNALGELLTPSVVGVDADGKLLIGRAARELQVMQPERCAGLFKRRMGSDWQAELPGREFSAEELSSLILRSLKEDATGFLKEPVERAVITVPAYFNDQQRKATIAAGRIAGLQVERIFNEPTAAALAYGFHETREDKILLIVDLGGGTFDVSVVELFEGTLEVRASSGESFLGGEDFTRALAARLLEQHGHPFERAELQAPRMVARMVQQCERAKCSLSRQDSFTLRIPDGKGEYHDSCPEVTVTRRQFDGCTRHMLNRLDLPIRRVLGDARLAVDQEEIWLRLLASAADQLAWAPAAADSLGLPECLHEAARHEHLQLRCADVFDRLEYLERAAAGWHALMRQGNVPADLLELLSRFWTRPFSEIRRGVAALLAAVAAAADLWLAHLDQVNEASPQLLSLCGQMLTSYKQTLSPDADDREPEELAVLARYFLEEHGGLRYSALRPRLLTFCLRELIHPDVIAQLALSRTVVLPETRANKLAHDWPLRHVYRACTLLWS